LITSAREMKETLVSTRYRCPWQTNRHQWTPS
jgi:hypothetical protein